VSAATILSATSLLLSMLWVVACYTATAGMEAETQQKLRFRAVAFLFSWLIFLGILGQTGYLTDFSSLPPPFFLFIGIILVSATLLGFSKLGKALIDTYDLRWLVAFQSFRILAEWALIQAYKEGVAPLQMTWGGLNLDVLSGLTALAFIFWKRPPVWLIVTWNIVAFALLINVVAIGMLSAPTPFRIFMDGPSTAWVSYFPYILLPGVLVFAALLGHILLFRALFRINTLLPLDEAGT
jgi:hypothetical protein